MRAVHKDALTQTSFAFAEKPEAAAIVGWGFGAYKFEYLKSASIAKAQLVLPAKSAAKKAAEDHLRAVYTVRDLINLPANHLGPAQLEKNIRAAVKVFGAKVTTVKDKELIKQNFPLVYMVAVSYTHLTLPTIYSV